MLKTIVVVVGAIVVVIVVFVDDVEAGVVLTMAIECCCLW